MATAPPEQSPVLVLVRPYHASIRDRVVALVEALGIASEPQLLIPRGTPDQDVLAQLAQFNAPPAAMVVPFHVHADTQGGRVDGLVLLQKLRRAHPSWVNVVTLMPVSQASRPGFMMASQALDTATWPRFFVVHEEELDDVAKLVQRLKL
jgi:hypothetical protein